MVAEKTYRSTNGLSDATIASVCIQSIRALASENSIKLCASPFSLIYQLNDSGATQTLTCSLIVECVRNEDESLENIHRYAVSDLEERITSLEKCLQRGQWIGTQPITEVERHRLETQSSALRMECMDLIHGRKRKREVHQEPFQEQWGYEGEHVF